MLMDPPDSMGRDWSILGMYVSLIIIKSTYN